MEFLVLEIKHTWNLVVVIRRARWVILLLLRDPPEPRQFHVRNVMAPPARTPYVVEREVAEKHRVHHQSRIWGAELKSVLKTTTAIHAPKRAEIVARILISELSAMKR